MAAERGVELKHGCAEQAQLAPLYVHVAFQINYRGCHLQRVFTRFAGSACHGAGLGPAAYGFVKLFVHITQETQDKQLAERLDVPWKRWKTGADDYRNRAKRADYLDAMHAMFKKTDTKHAPWHVIDNNHRKGGRIAALTYVAERLEALVPMDFPAADPAVVKLAKQAFGYQPSKSE